MWVKICGNTNLDDALHAAHAGADALGFIFAQSPRQLTAPQAAAITAHLPQGIERVGVFDSHDAAEILRTAREAALTTLQLHGGFDEPLLQQLFAPAAQLSTPGVGFSIIQALHWDVDDPSPHSAERILAELHRIARLPPRPGTPIRVLIDSRAGSASGGTGISFDWAAAARVFAEARTLGLPVIAAGGLRPEDVAEAIAHLQPWGVDVSSGVEASKGRKDPGRVAQFIANARG